MLEHDNIGISTVEAYPYFFMIPRLKFKISLQKDIETFFCFACDVKYDYQGRLLKWAIFSNHPFFLKYKSGKGIKIKKEIVQRYVEEFYRKNKEIIRRNLKLYHKKWDQKEKKFYELVSDLFHKKTWPKGKYIAYPTIWGMYPRFLEDKTFQIPYQYKKSKYVNVIIAHEMLHFIFYDYFYQKYPQYKKDKYNFFVWHVSEIFNVLVQNSTDWLKVFQLKSMPYPEHKKLIKKLNLKYRNTIRIEIDNLINDIIREIRKSNLIS